MAGRVVGQVAHDLGKPGAIPADPQRRQGNHVDRHRGVPTQPFGLFVHHVIQVDLLLRQREASVQAGQQQQVLHQALHPAIFAL